MTPSLRCAGAALGLVLMAGCATPAPAPAPATGMTSPFNAGDVAWSRAPGTASVEGRTAVADGQVSRSCAGGEAQLLPAGDYAAEMMRIVFGNEARGYAPLSSSPRYPAAIAADFKSTVRRVACDAEGRFRFDGVPAGRWYVFSNVVWRAVGAEGALQGGALMQRIDVAEGARTTVLLAP